MSSALLLLATKSMPYAKRKYSNEYPIHISARSNNREHFPLELHEVWLIMEDFCFLLKYGFQIEILSFVLMPNHFHMIIRDPNLNMSLGMEYFMRETSKEISQRSGKMNRIWGQKYHSSIIDSENYFCICYKYVYRNPVEAGLCSSVLGYRFSTLSFFTGRLASAIPLEEDTLLFSAPDETIKWLNEPFEKKHQEAIRKSLRRPRMKIPPCAVTRNPNRIELPDFLTH